MPNKGKPENLKPFGPDNPPPGNGRPRGSKNRSTILKKWLKVKRQIDGKRNPKGETVAGTVEDEIMLALIAKAQKGDVAAIREIQDTVYGKVSDRTELTGADGGPIKHEHKKAEDLTDDELAAEIQRNK